MASSPTRGLAAAIAVFVLTATNVVRQAFAQPRCIGDFTPVRDVASIFCPSDNVDGFCCTMEEETSIATNFQAVGVTGRCAEIYQEVLCGVCHPQSGHLYERLVTAMTLTNDFCDEFFAACATQLSLPPTYCDVHTGGDEDTSYAYPYFADGEARPSRSLTLGGDGLVKAFPDVEDAHLPTDPIDMRLTPDGSKWWVLGLMGQIVEIDKANPKGTTLMMDMSSKIRLHPEEGLMIFTLSFTFSPEFHSTGVFYASYVTVVSPDMMSYNRLSKFAYDGNPATTLASEVELITSSMEAISAIPSGWIGFKPSAYSSSSATEAHELFWAMGDPGDTTNNGQNPDTLRGGIMRITVDSQIDSSYSVPGSNPFSGGGGRAEICAQGFRNPWKCSFDRETDELFCGDVGQGSVESVKIIVCGNNYGWGRFEGDRCMIEKFPEYCQDVDRGPYTFPIFNYCHHDYYPEDEPEELVPSDDFCGDRSVIGGAVIGGFVYRGTKYADLLYGNYIFADFASSRLYNLYPNGSGGYGHGTVKADDFIQVSGFAEDHDGELYVIQFKGSIYELPCGDICDGANVNPVPRPVPVSFASYESVGCYTDKREERIMRWGFMSDSMTVEKCHEHCVGSIYFGVKNGKKCFCDEKEGDEDYPFDLHGVSTRCTVPCSGDQAYTCGGPWAMQVYKNAAYEKVGCYKDKLEERIMKWGFMSDDMTVEKCNEHCVGSIYFGVKYGKKCFCDEKEGDEDYPFDLHGESTDCTWRCSGNEAETCGGPWAMEVYVNNH